jgi:hypothetical protein
MTDRDRLIELIEKWYENPQGFTYLADYLLSNGVIVPHRLMGRLVYEINYDEKEKTYFIKSSKGGLEITLGNRL